MGKKETEKDLTEMRDTEIRERMRETLRLREEIGIVRETDLVERDRQRDR